MPSPYTSNSFYEPQGRLTTETSTSQFGLGEIPGGMGLDPQLASLLGAGMQNKLAMSQQRAAQEARMAALAEQEQMLRLKQMKRSMKPQITGPITRKVSSGPSYASSDEASFVQSVGGAQMTPGLIRSYAGTPGAVFGGWVPGGSAQPRGGGNISGGPAAPRSAEEFQDLNNAATQRLIDANSQNYGNSSVADSNARRFGRK